MIINYEKICEDILEDLTPRRQEILQRRFGLRNNEPSTLQFIGNEMYITRERVRQIENDSINWLKENQRTNLRKPFQYFLDYFNEYGGLREETKLLEELGKDKFQNHVLFLLNLGDDFNKFNETEEFYPLWAIESDYLKQARAVVKNIIKEFKQNNAPMEIKELGKKITFNLKVPVLLSYIDVSKFVFQSPFGDYGLVQWPEINPQGLKDQAYLVLKKENRPLHFTEIAKLISKLSPMFRQVLPESLHNELIRNKRFVLVGRGIYALREWGYEPGTVKQVIVKILKKSKKALSAEEIVKKVLEQRQIKKSTILLNLQDKGLFKKDKKGKYMPKRS